MNQDISQIQSQYYQTLNQANMKILQLNDLVAEAATKVAKEKGYDLVVNDESVYFSQSILYDQTGHRKNEYRFRQRTKR